MQAPHWSYQHKILIYIREIIRSYISNNIFIIKMKYLFYLFSLLSQFSLMIGNQLALDIGRNQLVAGKLGSE